MHRKVSKIEAGPQALGSKAPGILEVGHQALGSKSPDILGEKWDKILILSEDLFFLFFCLSPDFGQKMGRNLSVTISNSDLCSSQFSEVSDPPPLFLNPAYATGPRVLLFLGLGHGYPQY